MTAEAVHDKIPFLELQQDVYQPNETVAAELHDKTLLMLVGPSCIGKSTLMNAVVAMDDRFAITGTFTTRLPREEEKGKNYTFLPHTDEGINQVYQMVKNGAAVQFTVHPTTKDIYGSVLSDYPKDYNVLDTLASAVSSIEKLPVKRTEVFGIVADADDWQGWFDARFPLDHPKRHSRLEEAALSLRWLIDRHSDVVWILNAPGRQEVAAQEIIGSTLGTYAGDPTLVSAAEAILNKVKELL